MEEEREGGGGFGWGFMIGAFLGALAGVLMAPKGGKEFRSDLRERGTQAFGNARDFYTDATLKARAILDEAQTRATELKNEIDRQFSVTRGRLREILEKAEKEAEGKAPENGGEGKETESSQRV